MEFLRAQVAAFAGTAADYLATFILKDLLSVWYVVATGCGALVGAIVNFVMGRQWAFKATEGKVGGQAFRYALVSFGSLILNTGGVYAWVELTSEAWVYPAKVVVGLLVGITWNFFMQKYFVYKKK